jgi:hypothetical protein
MAILDKFGEVSSNQDFTGLGTLTVSTNSIDLSPDGVHPRDFGQGNQLFFNINVGTAFTTGTGALMTMAAVISSASDLGFGSTEFLCSIYGGTASNLLVAGAEFKLPIAGLSTAFGHNGLRYLGIWYTTAIGATWTAGKLTATLCQDSGASTKPHIYATGYRGP